MTCVSTRTLRIHLSPTRGLCHHVDVFFDYAHLCAVELVIYGFMTSIIPGLQRYVIIVLKGELVKCFLMLIFIS